MKMVATNHSPFEVLPEGCIADIISFTTPQEACTLSLVSKNLCSAATSDTVWERFLSSDYDSINSQSPSSASLLSSSSKKNLYFTLNPIIFDDGRKVSVLSGRVAFLPNKFRFCDLMIELALLGLAVKCHIHGIRKRNRTALKEELSIGQAEWEKVLHACCKRSLHCLGDTSRYWVWKSLPESRFKLVAELVNVCWLEIRGNICTRMLSPKTHYAAYLVFKLKDRRWLGRCPAEVSVGIFGGHRSSENVCLDPVIGEDQQFLGLQRPRERNDGWLEIKMGDFYNLGEKDELVETLVIEIIGGDRKRGLVLEGIEVRPKEDN